VLEKCFIKEVQQFDVEGENSSNFLGSPERKSDTEDCECDIPVIYHHSNVDEPRPAAEPDVMIKKHNGMQRRIIESTSYLIDGTTCLDSQTNRQILIEEVYHNNGFEEFCVLLEMNYTRRKDGVILNHQDNFLYKGSRERRLEERDCECDMPAIYHHYNVDKLRQVAEPDVVSKKHNGMQRRVV
jgi:hypothetical protein